LQQLSATHIAAPCLQPTTGEQATYAILRLQIGFMGSHPTSNYQITSASEVTT